MNQATSFSVVGNVVDIVGRRIYPAEVAVAAGKIASIKPVDSRPSTYLLPGFIDAHVHVESSMLVPSEFARAAVVHGTVATVSDPHEIGNVLGVAGVHYMLENAAHVPLKFNFGAPSCVPATTFETAGAEITVAEVEALLDDPRIRYLSEMMNFPGILYGDAGCLAKVKAAHDRGKPVDGHAPGLRGEQAAKYIAAGITTDHECFTKEEALDKLAAGCKISIREGSAARNFDALYTLLGEFPGHDDALQRRQTSRRTVARPHQCARPPRRRARHQRLRCAPCRLHRPNRALRPRRRAASRRRPGRLHRSRFAHATLTS